MNNMETPQVTFFTDNKGHQSMSRLGMFVNVLVAAFVSIYTVTTGTFNTDYMMLVFGLWTFAYGGKSASAHLENIKELKGK